MVLGKPPSLKPKAYLVGQLVGNKMALSSMVGGNLVPRPTCGMRKRVPRVGLGTRLGWGVRLLCNVLESSAIFGADLLASNLETLLRPTFTQKSDCPLRHFWRALFIQMCH